MQDLGLAKFLIEHFPDLPIHASTQMTAKEWKDKNPNLDGNMRDYANIMQLIILVNLENLNAEMIEQGLEQSNRLERLNLIAKKQLDILQGNAGIKKIENLDNIKLIDKK